MARRGRGEGSGSTAGEGDHMDGVESGKSREKGKGEREWNGIGIDSKKGGRYSGHPNVKPNKFEMVAGHDEEKG